MPTSTGRLRPHLRVILYARVSRDFRQGRSVAQQLAIGRQIAADQGWEVVGEYSDNDRSASQYATRTREDWPKVEAAIASGGADALWVWEISRGTRDMVVWAQLARACEDHGMHLALDEDLWDTTNPDHMKYLHSLMVDAVHEAGKTRKRILRNVAAHAAEGRPYAGAGYGFVREYDPRTGDLVCQVVDPDQAQMIREIARRYLSGETFHEIAADLNARGVANMGGYVVGEQMVRRSGEPMLRADGTPRISAGWMHTTIRDLMRRPALIGKRAHRGEIIEEGGWDPILSEEDWWSIQYRIQRTSSQFREQYPHHAATRDGGAQHILTGIAVCGECGGQIGTIRRSEQRDPTRRVYACRGLYQGAPLGHVSRLEAKVDGQLEALVVAEFSMPDVVERFRPSGASSEEAGAHRARAQRVRSELEQLYGDVEAGRVSRRMAAADEARLQRELGEAERGARPAPVDPMVAELADDDPSVVADRWRGWLVSQKRAALRSFTESIRLMPVGGRKITAPGESLEITWRGRT